MRKQTKSFMFHAFYAKNLVFTADYLHWFPNLSAKLRLARERL